ncbi:MAG: hypothetical protein CM1200mP2_44970 [Planctomycetaceae bacterium]|nr:MAG: hypothetical protein CM1200mP2_44970 [Planctomycetaceae bacterium]
MTAGFFWHPFTPMQAYASEAAPVIVAGEGFYLIDESGQRYLDGVSSLWCNVHGHRSGDRSRDLRATGPHRPLDTARAGSDPSIELARQLVERTPAGLDHVFYSGSGSTGVEAALKIAWQFQRQSGTGGAGRDLFVGLSGAYHGDTIGSVSLGQIDLFHSVYGPLLFDTMTLPAPVAFRHPEGFTDQDGWIGARRKWNGGAGNHERIAAVVIEPLVQGAPGFWSIPKGTCGGSGVDPGVGLLLIPDEVAVAFGRTGTLFACEHEEVTRICVPGQGVDRGYCHWRRRWPPGPFSKRFWVNRTRDESSSMAHLHGERLGCAAALASLDLFETNPLENVGEGANG